MYFWLIPFFSPFFRYLSFGVLHARPFEEPYLCGVLVTSLIWKSRAWIRQQLHDNKVNEALEWDIIKCGAVNDVWRRVVLPKLVLEKQPLITTHFVYGSYCAACFGSCAGEKVTKGTLPPKIPYIIYNTSIYVLKKTIFFNTTTVISFAWWWLCTWAETCSIIRSIYDRLSLTLYFCTSVTVGCPT
jgi:hypothetical protein